jgi:hypothetical protein
MEGALLSLLARLEGAITSLEKENRELHQQLDETKAPTKE